MSRLLVTSLGISTAMSSLRGLLHLLECSPEGLLLSLITILTFVGVPSCSKISLATLNISTYWLSSCSNWLMPLMMSGFNPSTIAVLVAISDSSSPMKYICTNLGDSPSANKVVDLTLYSTGWVEASQRYLITFKAGHLKY